MDRAGYSFVGYANADGPTVVCDLPAVSATKENKEKAEEAKVKH